MPLSDCTVDEQCCSKLVCGENGMCCAPINKECNDDSDCCHGHCVGQPGLGAFCTIISSTP